MRMRSIWQRLLKAFKDYQTRRKENIKITREIDQLIYDLRSLMEEIETLKNKEKNEQ